MPNSDGRLTEEDHQKAQEWLRLHWTRNRICPMSDHNAWEIGAQVVAAPPFAGRAMTQKGIVYPTIPVTCSVCGYTLYFNAVVMGIVAPEDSNG